MEEYKQNSNDVNGNQVVAPTDQVGTTEESLEPTPTKQPSGGGTNKVVWILVAVIALIIGVVSGYAIGVNKEQSASAQEQQLQQQVDDLENQLNEATEGAAAQEESEKDNEIADLKAQNAQLEADNAALQKQVDDLQDQIDNAGNSTTN